ncbi:hypothetical protein A249_14946 [Pseudomonas syringae pv. actinidiae ICMP 18804]|nr:hypothetical protein A249_14946 [Pseudomonas syringae pv. actinidiae ICMP 18804]
MRPCTQVLTKPFGLDALAGRVTGLIGADTVAQGCSQGQSGQV